MGWPPSCLWTALRRYAQCRYCRRRAGGQAALIRECSTIKFVPSLASFATTISYPAKTSHRAYSPEDMKAAGISMGQLRFSIGLEDAEDIIAELDEALEKV